MASPARNRTEWKTKGAVMTPKNGERVRHPRRTGWGLGLVRGDWGEGKVTGFFENAGEKTLDVQIPGLEVVVGEAAQSELLDRLGQAGSPPPSRTAFKPLSRVV